VVSHGVSTGELCDEVRDVLVLVDVGVSLSQPVTGTSSQHSRIRRTRGAMMFTPNGCRRWKCIGLASEALVKLGEEARRHWRPVSLWGAARACPRRATRRAHRHAALPWLLGRAIVSALAPMPAEAGRRPLHGPSRLRRARLGKRERTNPRRGTFGLALSRERGKIRR